MITITIDGDRGMGKTTAAQIIAGVYEKLGVAVEIEDGGEIWRHRMRLKDAKRNVRESLRKGKVCIKVRQAKS